MAGPISSKMKWELMNPILAQALNPIIASPINGLNILENQILITGANVINHGLGRMMLGWFIIDLQDAATIYRSQPLNSSTLTLTSNIDATVSIGVF